MDGSQKGPSEGAAAEAGESSAPSAASMGTADESISVAEKAYVQQMPKQGKSPARLMATGQIGKEKRGMIERGKSERINMDDFHLKASYLKVKTSRASLYQSLEAVPFTPSQGIKTPSPTNMAIFLLGSEAPSIFQPPALLVSPCGTPTSMLNGEGTFINRTSSGNVATPSSPAHLAPPTSTVFCPNAGADAEGDASRWPEEAAQAYTYSHAMPFQPYYGMPHQPQMPSAMPAQTVLQGGVLYNMSAVPASGPAYSYAPTPPMDAGILQQRYSGYNMPASPHHHQQMPMQFVMPHAVPVPCMWPGAVGSDDAGVTSPAASSGSVGYGSQPNQQGPGRAAVSPFHSAAWAGPSSWPSGPVGGGRGAEGRGGSGHVRGRFGREASRSPSSQGSQLGSPRRPPFTDARADSRKSRSAAAAAAAASLDASVGKENGSSSSVTKPAGSEELDSASQERRQALSPKDSGGREGGVISRPSVIVPVYSSDGQLTLNARQRRTLRRALQRAKRVQASSDSAELEWVEPGKQLKEFDLALVENVLKDHLSDWPLAESTCLHSLAHSIMTQMTGQPSLPQPPPPPRALDDAGSSADKQTAAA